MPDRLGFSWPSYIRYFLGLGTTGFGGPIALAAAMQRDLVEDRAWVSESEYNEGMALAQLAPGPLATQLAIYLGWLRGGVAIVPFLHGGVVQEHAWLDERQLLAYCKVRDEIKAYILTLPEALA